MYLTLIAIGCSEYFPTVSTAVPSVSSDTSSNAEEADPIVAIASAPPTLTVSMPELFGRTIEVQPFYDGLDPMRTGDLLASEVVDGPVFELALPAHTAYGTDIAEVAYAIALRDTESDGSPGVYLGISDATLVWSVDEVDDAGWALILNYGTDHEQQVSFDIGADVYENLLGWPDLMLGGQNLLPEPGAHLEIASCDDDNCIVAYDSPLGPDDWSAQAGTPSAASLETTDDLEGAVYDLSVYIDSDGDNSRTSEGVIGTACLGVEPVVATWYQAAWDFDTAMEMRAQHVRSAWNVSLDTVDGFVEVGQEERGNLVLAESCD